MIPATSGVHWVAGDRILLGLYELVAYQLQHFLGHASITNTVRYTAMSPEPFKDVWRR